MPASPQRLGPAPDATVQTLQGFSWVVDEQLAGMPLLGASNDLGVDMTLLRDEGITELVSLTEVAIDAEVAMDHRIRVEHLPIPDFHAPTQNQIERFVELVSESLRARKRVGVHCRGGKGRTGTMLATWFLHEGMSADEAIAHTRSPRPGSIETLSQEQAIAQFATNSRSRIESIQYGSIVHIGY